MSAFYDLASLVVVPSGYKSGKIYAQKPLTTDGQLTFSRASTATRVNASGLIETVSSNVPRLDYTNSTCPKLLLEKQSTNYFTDSAPMVTTGWTSTGATLTAGQSDPAGGTGALRVQLAAGSSSIYRIFGYAAVSYARSAYMKANTAQSVRFEDPFTGNGVVANLTTQWQRFSFAEVVSIGLGMQFSNANDNAAKDFFVAFPQIEESTYATSFIPTTTAAVTRLADACSKTGISSLIGQTEGTFFAEVTLLGNTGNFNVLNTNNSTTNAITLHIEGSKVRGYVYANSSLYNSIIGGSVSVGNTYKMAYAYKSGDAALYLNGVQIGTASQTWAFSASVDKIEVADPDTYFSYQEGIKFAQALLFKTRLTNAQLAELTTL